MLRIYKELREWGNVSEKLVGKLGLFAEIPAKDGTYDSKDGQKITVEMNPPERSRHRRAIALHSADFKGHTRSIGFKGNERRVIDVSQKKNRGATRLSAFVKLVVELIDKK